MKSQVVFRFLGVILLTIVPFRPVVTIGREDIYLSSAQAVIYFLFLCMLYYGIIKKSYLWQQFSTFGLSASCISIYLFPKVKAELFMSRIYSTLKELGFNYNIESYLKDYIKWGDIWVFMLLGLLLMVISLIKEARKSKQGVNHNKE